MDGLHEESAGVRSDRLAQGFDIAERDYFKSRGKGTEAVAILLVGREAHDRHGAAMEIVRAHDDLGFAVRDTFHLVAPLASRLHGCFDCFRARIHRKGHIEAGQIVEFLVKRPELIIAKCPRGEGDLVRLFRERLQNSGMAVPLIDGRVGGEAVQIAVAFDVIHPYAPGAFDHDVERMIVMRTELVFEFDELAGGLLNHHFGKHTVPFVISGYSLSSSRVSNAIRTYRPFLACWK